MTANEMKYNMLLLYDKLFEYGSPAYDDRQIGAILSKAQLRIYKRYYMPNRNKFNEGFESTEKRRTDLEQFIKNASVSGGQISVSADQTGVHPDGVFYDMPTDYLYPVEEAVVTSDSTPQEITVKPIKHDYYRANIRNPYKKPYSNLAWRMDFSRLNSGSSGGDTFTGQTAKRTEIIPKSGSTINDYRVRYLITIPDIVCDEITPTNQRHSIFDESLHDEIVDEAAKIAAAAAHPEKYQIADKEQKDNES